MRNWPRRIRWLWGQLYALFGILVCLVLIGLLLPLVPLFKAYENARRLYENDGE